MKYLSLFSGIEAFTQAVHDFGWTCVGVSEIDPFACEVLKTRLPHVHNLGDITKITKEKLDDLKQSYNGIDLVVGGSPCQSFSVAGLRKGLEDPRGNLMLEYIRIVTTVRPRWFIWENVPGALSSGGGSDFGTLLQAMAQFGYNLGWRVLDAQHYGVPQRRRRVFLVGSLDKADGPFKVLFERQSSKGHTQSSGETRQSNPAKVETSVGEHGETEGGESNEKVVYHSNHRGIPPKEHATCPTLMAWMGTGGNNIPMKLEDSDQKVTMLESNQNHATMGDMSVSPTLNAAMGQGGGHVPMIVEQTQPEHVYWLKTLRTGGDCEKSVCPALTAQTGDTLPTVIDQSESTLTQDIYRKSKNAQSVDDFETWVKDEKTNTLASFYSQPNIAIVEHHAYNITFNDANGTRKDRPNGGCYINDTDVSNAITTGGVHDTKVVEHEMENELCSTLCARDYKGPSNDDFTATSQKLVLEHQHEQQKVQSKVRKLTPIECERLQGFPDNYTQIPYNKKKAEDCPDSPRYKALGNSMAVPVMRWIACRIALVDGLLVPSFRPTSTKVDK